MGPIKEIAMADHFQLQNFAVKDSGGENVVVLISGHRKYYDIIRHAFQDYRFSRAFDDQYSRYDWGTYVYNVQESNRARIIALLELFEQAVCIEDALDRTFALDYHMRPYHEGRGRTEIGELLY